MLNVIDGIRSDNRYHVITHRGWMLNVIDGIISDNRYHVITHRGWMLNVLFIKITFFL